MLRPRVTDWLARVLRRRTRAAVSVLAGNSVLLRSLPDAPGSRVAAVVDTALDGIVGLLVGVTVTVTLADLRLLGLALDAALYLYVLSRLIPRFLPDEPPAGDVFATRRVVLTASLNVLVLAFPLSMVLPVMFSTSPVALVSAATGVQLTMPSTVGPTALAAAWFLLTMAAIGTYFYLSWWRKTSIDDRVQFVDQVAPGSIERDETGQIFERSDWIARTESCATVVYTAFWLASVFLLLGIVSAVMVVLFPLPELIVFAGAVTGGLSRLRPDSRVAAIADRRFDLEEQFLLVLRYIRISRKGMAAAPYLLCGVMVSITVALLSNLIIIALGAGVPAQPMATARAAINRPLLMWVGFGSLVCFTVPGLYSLWFWLRQAVRLPNYLVYWERTHEGTATIVEKDLSTPPTRPYGNLLVPTPLFVPIIVLLAVIPLDQQSTPVLVALAVAWPALIALVVYSVRRTLRDPPQHPSTDGWAIPLAFFIQLGWLWLLWGGWAFPEQETLLILPRLTVIFVLTTIWYFSPELYLVLHATIGDYSSAALAALFAGSLAVCSRLVGTEVEWIFLIVAALIAAGAAFAMVMARVENEV